MARAGTGWLYDQLHHHPDFWMPPLKEINFFSPDFPGPRVERLYAEWEQDPIRRDRKLARKKRKPMSEQDVAFLRDAIDCRNKERDVELYTSLFRHKQEKLSGDITPAYRDLSEETCSRLVEALPDLKIILLVRDPVARAWSRMMLGFRKGRHNVDKLTQVDKFRKIFLSSTSSQVSQTKLYTEWKARLPQSRLGHFFLEKTESDPEAQLRDILKFLGADPALKTEAIPVDHNRKARAKKFEMSPEIREFLVGFFRDELMSSVEVFGPPAKQWQERYGLG